MAEALGSARRAVALDPLSPRLRNSLIGALAYIGNVDAARRELDEAQRIWPLSQTLREVAFRFHLRFGDPRIALRAVEAGEGNRYGPADREAEQTRAFVRARLDPTPANIAAAIRPFGPSGPPLGSFWQLQTLGLFGRTDGRRRRSRSCSIRVARRCFATVPKWSSGIDSARCVKTRAS